MRADRVVLHMRLRAYLPTLILLAVFVLLVVGCGKSKY